MWEWTDPNPKQIREKILKGGNAKKFDKYAIQREPCGFGTLWGAIAKEGALR